MLVYDKEEPVTDNLITWVFDENSFVPAAKLVGDKSYSILTDHLGTPYEAYDENGEKVWSAEYDLYGNIHTLEGEKGFIPFRYQGQYEDVETGLYYSRFRFYSPDSGTYISQDPIRLAGGLAFYGYVMDCNGWINPWGLFWRNPTRMGHHLVYKQKANSVGLTDLGTDLDTPTFFFDDETYIDGTHERVHKHQDPFVGGRQGKFNGTAEELLHASRKGLEGLDDIKGDLKIPRTKEILAKNVTPLEAFDKLMEWHQEQLNKKHH